MTPTLARAELTAACIGAGDLVVRVARAVVRELDDQSAVALATDLCSLLDCRPGELDEWILDLADQLVAGGVADPHLCLALLRITARAARRSS